MKFKQLSQKTEINTMCLIPHLRFLINRGLLKQQIIEENETVYVVTERGLKILRVINPLVKEAHKFQLRNFKIISNTLSDAGYS